MAATVVGHKAESLMASGRRFYKMSGSGNDFVFFDLEDGDPGNLETADEIRRICARGTGVGADGVVFFARTRPDAIAITYYNSDGSGGELCGNATLCSVRLAELLGGSCTDGVVVTTDAGQVEARLVEGLPEIDLEAVTQVTTDFSEIPPEGSESRIGYALVGVPHIVVEVPDVAGIDVIRRGSRIRRDRSLPVGANVNFLASCADGRWMIRTYERGVEGETLACGTGAVASAILLTAWGKASSPVRLVTKSGRTLVVGLTQAGEEWRPSLRGSADLIFVGELPTQV
jgi:diaminopimelate epimerase